MNIHYIMTNDATDAIKSHIEPTLEEMLSAVKNGHTDNHRIHIVERIGAYIDLEDTPTPQDVVSEHFRDEGVEGHVMLILGMGADATFCCTFVCDEPQEAEDVLRMAFTSGTADTQEFPKRVQRLWDVGADAEHDLPLMRALTHIAHYAGLTGAGLSGVPIREIRTSAHPTKRLLCQCVCSLLGADASDERIELPMTWGRAAIHICEALKQQAEAVVRAARKQGIPAAVPDEMLLPATLIAVAKRWMGYHMHELHRSSWAPIVMRLRNKLLDAFLESNPHAGVIVMHTRKSRDDDRSIQVDLYSSKRDVEPS